MTSFKTFDVPEVLDVHVVPLSDEVKTVPDSPTAINSVEVVVFVSSVVELLSSLLFLAQEMMVKLKRNMEKTMSICLTWFPFGGLGEPKLYHNSGMFYKNVGILLGGYLTVKN